MNDKIDYLVRDVLAAQRAGMSYGNWKALHPNTREGGEILDEEIDLPDRDDKDAVYLITCVRCGKKFYAKSVKAKYCPDECRKKKYKIREERKKRAEQKVMENEHT